MSSSLAKRLDGVPLRNAKATLQGGEGEVQKLNPDAGAVLEEARAAAQLEPKQMAGDMGVSHSYVLRGLKSQDDLGFHKLWSLSDDFWAELVIAIAKRRRIGAAVKVTIELDRKVG